MGTGRELLHARDENGSRWVLYGTQRGMRMGNDGVYAEWEWEREWEREREWEFEREWERESLSSIWNENEDGNRRDKCGMGAKIRKSGACYMGLMAIARERYRSAHQCITTG